MYEIDTKFFNNDGSFDVEAACVAGRKSRARAVREGARQMARGLVQIADAARHGASMTTLMTPTRSGK